MQLRTAESAPGQRSLSEFHCSQLPESSALAQASSPSSNNNGDFGNLAHLDSLDVDACRKAFHAAVESGHGPHADPKPVARAVESLWVTTSLKAFILDSDGRAGAAAFDEGSAGRRRPQPSLHGADADSDPGMQRRLRCGSCWAVSWHEAAFEISSCLSISPLHQGSLTSQGIGRTGASMQNSLASPQQRCGPDVFSFPCGGETGPRASFLSARWLSPRPLCAVVRLHVA